MWNENNAKITFVVQDDGFRSQVTDMMVQENGLFSQRIVFIAPFGTRPKATTRARIIPLARALAERGHSVKVLVPPYDQPSEAGHRWQAGKAAIHCVPLPIGASTSGIRQVPGIVLLAFRLIKEAMTFHPDIIHISKPKGVSGLTHALLWWRQRLNLSYHPNGPALIIDSDDWEGHGGWNENEDAYLGWQKYIFDCQEHWGFQHADAGTVASRALQERATGLGLCPERVFYLPNGLSPIDYPDWHDRAGQEPRSTLRQPTIALYTRFFEFAPERPVHLLASVHAQIPDAVLQVIGAGKYGQEKRLLAEARRIGIENSVHFTGWLDFTALPTALAKTDVALVLLDDTLANRAKCSMKLVELLWLGLPVVAECVGENSRYINHLESGIVVPPGDDDATASALVSILDEPIRASHMGAAAHQRIVTNFSWENLVIQAEKAYKAAKALGPVSPRSNF